MGHAWTRIEAQGNVEPFPSSQWTALPWDLSADRGALRRFVPPAVRSITRSIGR